MSLTILNGKIFLLHFNHMRESWAVVDLLEQFLDGLWSSLGFTFDLMI